MVGSRAQTLTWLCQASHIMHGGKVPPPHCFLTSPVLASPAVMCEWEITG